MKRIFLSLALLSPATHAANFNDGLEAYRRQDFERAYSLLSKQIRGSERAGATLAQISETQYALGMMLLKGQGTHKNPGQAFNWLLEAAANQHRQAAYQLGLMYLQGVSISKDTAKAAAWLETSAKQGLAEAQYQLGKLYLEGAGVPKDKQTALFWLQEASEAGFDQATQLVLQLYPGRPGLFTDAAGYQHQLIAHEPAAQAMTFAAAPEALLVEPAVQAKPMPEPDQQASTVVPTPAEPVAAVAVADAVLEAPPSSAPVTVISSIPAPVISAAPLPVAAVIPASVSAPAVVSEPLPTPGLALSADQQTEGWAVQLAAGQDRDKVEVLAGQFPAALNLQLYGKQIKGRTWYVLLQCCFATREQAYQQIAGFSAALKQKQPFALPLSMVQKVQP